MNQQLSNTLATQSSQLLQLQQTQAEPTEVVRLDDTAVRELEAATSAEISALRAQVALPNRVVRHGTGVRRGPARA